MRYIVLRCPDWLHHIAQQGECLYEGGESEARRIYADAPKTTNQHVVLLLKDDICPSMKELAYRL